MAKPIRVLIIDDSELIRTILIEMLSQDEHIEVVGTAYDPIDAREKIKQLSPDVLTLDIEMPRMDGLTFLANLMRLRPTPVVMISTLTEKGAESTLRAMELGAIDFIAKPKMSVKQKLPDLTAKIIQKIKVAARANVLAIDKVRRQVQAAPTAINGFGKLNDKVKMVVIGASTGGTEAIKSVLTNLPDAMPPIVIVQHMPQSFTHSFAKRLDGLVKLRVEAFEHSCQELLNDHVYIASGQHMLVEQRLGKLVGVSEDSEPVNRHKPAVDKLFDSVSEFCTHEVVAVILTGMGMDGASGMYNMRAKGALTIAQDEASSVVWGMPRAAIEQQGAAEILPLESIGKRLAVLCYG